MKVIEKNGYTNYKLEEGDRFIPMFDKVLETTRKGPHGNFTAYSTKLKMLAGNNVNSGEEYFLNVTPLQAKDINDNSEKVFISYGYATAKNDSCVGVKLEEDAKIKGKPAVFTPSEKQVTVDALEGESAEAYKAVVGWVNDKTVTDADMINSVKSQSALSEEQISKLITLARS